MELSKLGKTAIVVVRVDVERTLVVMQLLANSILAQSVIPVTRIAVHQLVNLPQVALSAGLVQALAILRRLAAVLLLLAQLMLLLQMVCCSVRSFYNTLLMPSEDHPVATPALLLVLQDNVHPETCNARH